MAAARVRAAKWADSSSCAESRRERPLSSREIFEGLQRLTTESRNPATTGIDLASTEEVLRLLHGQDRTVLDPVEAALPKLVPIVDKIVEAFATNGRLFYAGAGTSGRLGVLDAAECPPTFGSDPERVVGLIAGGSETLTRSREGVEDRPDDGARDVDAHELGPHDVLIGISASRRTPYVHGALTRARERGVWTAFLVCNELEEDPVAVADAVVEVVVGPEAIAGSTRMKAALAQKMMLTMISTAAMVRSGKIYENLMVDVRPTSEKLRERAKGLVMHLAAVDYPKAQLLLEAAVWDVKLATLMGRFDESLDVARVRLDAAGGFLRAALEAPR